MMLREEVEEFRRLSGEAATHTPIMRLGAFLDGYHAAIDWHPADEAPPEWKPLLCIYSYMAYIAESDEPRLRIDYGRGTSWQQDGKTVWSGEIRTGRNAQVLYWMIAPEPPEDIRTSPAWYWKEEDDA